MEMFEAEDIVDYIYNYIDQVKYCKMDELLFGRSERQSTMELNKCKNIFRNFRGKVIADIVGNDISYEFIKKDKIKGVCVINNIEGET